MGTAGVYFPHDALMARRAFINSNEDFVRRATRPIPKACIACSPIRRGKAGGAKFARTNDPKIVDAVYQYALDYIEKIPYNSREAVQEVLNQAAVRNPKAKEAKPESFTTTSISGSWTAKGFISSYGNN